MDFLFGMVVCGIIIYFFLNPVKAKELETKFKDKIEEHKDERNK